MIEPTEVLNYPVLSKLALNQNPDDGVEVPLKGSNHAQNGLGYFEATYIAVNGTIAPGPSVVEYVPVSAFQGYREIGAVHQLCTCVQYQVSFPMQLMAGHNSKSESVSMQWRKGGGYVMPSKV